MSTYFRNWILWTLAAGFFLTACANSQPTKTASSSPQPDSPQPVLTLLPAESPPRGAENEFTTDFSKHSVPYSEILSGGPPKDGIPPIDAPNFQSVNEADDWLEDREPIVFVQVGDDARAYPIQILIWHVFYKLKSAQFIIEKVPTLKKERLKLLFKRGPLYY